MSKILDLGVFQEETLDIKMIDGTTIHIIKPTEAMVIRVLQLRNIGKELDAEKVVKAFNDLVLSIINTNDAGIVYERKYVEELSMKVKSAIINAYAEFISGIQSNPF